MSTPAPIGPIDSSLTPRYAGFGTFARLPQTHEVSNYDIAVMGVPFDAGVSFRSGARFGPTAVREASRLLRPYNPAQDTSPFAMYQVVDTGDITANPFNIEEALDQVEAVATTHLAQGRQLLTIGGDHTIALPLLRAMAKQYGPVALLHFDAHLDTWDTYFSAPYTHGTPFRRASEEGILLEEHMAHVGIRGPLYGKNDLVEDLELGFGIVSTLQVAEQGVDRTIAGLRERIGSAPLYISVDIDVLDPAHAPGTGTPEAGGLTSRELLALLRGLSECAIIGADVVEVSPAYDHAQITAVAASHVSYELVTAMALSRERVQQLPRATSA